MTYQDILNIFKYYRVHFHHNCKGDFIIDKEYKNNFEKCEHYFKHYAENQIIDNNNIVYDMRYYKVIMCA